MTSHYKHFKKFYCWTDLFSHPLCQLNSFNSHIHLDFTQLTVIHNESPLAFPIQHLNPKLLRLRTLELSQKTFNIFIDELNKMHTNKNLHTEAALNGNSSLYHASSTYSDHSDPSNPLIQYFSNNHQCQALPTNYQLDTPHKMSSPSATSASYGTNLLYNPASSSSNSSCSSSNSDALTDLDFLLTTNTTNNPRTNIIPHRDGKSLFNHDLINPFVID